MFPVIEPMFFRLGFFGGGSRARGTWGEGGVVIFFYLRLLHRTMICQSFFSHQQQQKNKNILCGNCFFFFASHRFLELSADTHKKKTLVLSFFFCYFGIFQHIKKRVCHASTHTHLVDFVEQVIEYSDLIAYFSSTGKRQKRSLWLFESLFLI